ncbi:hypothetical protein V6C03_11090 [Methyloligella sp. 2.7D]|uniref:hypothetical protein n=1 Tax=unclassified Methyloligella TaxID=2625955 RepID=UPI001FEF758A|nr:hypothetical protein [Methyloligella sp. GL2]
MAFQSTRDKTPGRFYLLTSILFVSYLCVAIPLPVVPVYVTETLGLGNVWAGLAVGIAFLATIATRGYAGLGFTAFGGGFVLVRILFGHLPDRLGGLPVAVCQWP